MLLADTVPMLLADPIAMMHWPTFSADGWAVITLRYLVAAVVVTVMVVSAPAAAGFRLLPCTAKPPADNEVTLPLAPPKPPKPNGPRLPLGRGLGVNPGRGEKVPRGPPNPPNPPAGLQLPPVGVLMVTVVAVTDLVADPLAEG
jgi:hypothetical protein